MSPNAEKRMRVEVPIGTCENSNTVAAPLAVNHRSSTENVTGSTSQANVIILSDELIIPAIASESSSATAAAVATDLYEPTTTTAEFAAILEPPATAGALPTTATTIHPTYATTTNDQATPANVLNNACPATTTTVNQAFDISPAANVNQSTDFSQANNVFLVPSTTKANNSIIHATTKYTCANLPVNARATQVTWTNPRQDHPAYQAPHNFNTVAKMMNSVATQTPPTINLHPNSFEYIHRDNIAKISTNSPTNTTGSAQLHQLLPLPAQVSRLRNVDSNNVVYKDRQESVVSHMLSIANREEPRKWFHVSPFQPHETAENLSRFVSMRTNCNIDQVICQKLVSENRMNGPPLTFVSFKLSVPDDVIPSLSSTNFWPEGIVIKPFLYQRPLAKRFSGHYLPTNALRSPISRLAVQRSQTSPSVHQMQDRYQFTAPSTTRTNITQSNSQLQTLV